MFTGKINNEYEMRYDTESEWGRKGLGSDYKKGVKPSKQYAEASKKAT